MSLSTPQSNKALALEAALLVMSTYVNHHVAVVLTIMRKGDPQNGWFTEHDTSKANPPEIQGVLYMQGRNEWTVEKGK